MIALHRDVVVGFLQCVTRSGWFLLLLLLFVGLEYFRNVLLVSCTQDYYIPFHSSRIEIGENAVNDKTRKGATFPLLERQNKLSILYLFITSTGNTVLNAGKVYRDMVSNLLKPVIASDQTTLVRYDVFFGLKNNVSTAVAGTAHADIAAHPVFLDKFINIVAPKYFL